MRLIDAYKVRCDRDDYDTYADYIKTFDAINDAPTIDAVPVIRCKDCKHRPRRIEKNGGNWFDLEFPDNRCPCQGDDGRYNWMPDDNWYCGNAERKCE